MTDSENKDPSESGKAPETGAKHKIYVNEQAYEVDAQNLSGAKIKALADAPAEYQLFLEQEGDDRPVSDSETVKLHNNMRFYTLPPATFG